MNKFSNNYKHIYPQHKKQGVTDEKKNEVLEQLLKGAIEVLPNSENGRIASLLYSEGYCTHTGGYGDKNRYTITGKRTDF